MKIKLPFVILAVLSVGFLYDGIGYLRYSLIAAIIHELSHITVFSIATHTLPKISAEISGFSLSAENIKLTSKQDLIVTAAGPLANLIIFTVCYIILKYQASFSLYFFCAVNIFLALFNMIPLSFLDGGRFFQLLLPAKYVNTYFWVSFYFSCIFIFIIGIFVLTNNTSFGFKMAGVLFMMYFFIKTFGEKLH